MLEFLITAVGIVGIMAMVAIGVLGMHAWISGPNEPTLEDAETDAQRDLGVREVTDE